MSSSPDQEAICSEEHCTAECNRHLSHTVLLPTGCLQMHVDWSDIPFEQMTGFAARNNSKRGFLFISKVLGKHIPVRPSVMADTHLRLAGKILSAAEYGVVDAPTVVVGMAETATALGQGVFDALVSLSGMSGTYLSTTRYRIGLPRLNFVEAHSHATAQYLHLPQEDSLAADMARARTVVLVDDEVSTGNTFVNLANALKKALPQMRELIIVSLLNWLAPEAREHLQSRMPCPVRYVSLLSGCFRFVPDTAYVFYPSVRSEAAPTDRDASLPLPGGRRGVNHSYRYPVEALATTLKLPKPGSTGPLLVLGTGEFMYEPYLLARHLEEQGYSVVFQATTRSPILEGHDIHSVLQCEDNYGESIDNFLYNATAEHYDRVILCYETHSLPRGHSLPEQLRADVLYFPVPGTVV